MVHVSAFAGGGGRVAPAEQSGYPARRFAEQAFDKGSSLTSAYGINSRLDQLLASRDSGTIGNVLDMTQ